MKRTSAHRPATDSRPLAFALKRAIVLLILLLAIAGYFFLQTQTRQNLAQWMPGGALLYLESPDFGSLLREWNASSVKSGWLASANYEVFSRTNLLTKLSEVYQQYGTAAGFLPDLQKTLGIAGTESALALYEIREVEFLYVTKIGEAQLAKSQLWALRDRFEQRQAGGVPFYLRRDPESKRTVAFAFTKGYLFLATRDDLVARALALVAGGQDPSIFSERWYHEATAAAGSAGELRLVLNLESLLKSGYFRSYWIQRNASSIRPYWTGIADVTRSRTAITETRVFLRDSETESAAPLEVSNLVGLVPPDAGLYRFSIRPAPSAAAALIVQKLMASATTAPIDERFAPVAIALDARAGSEADLETRIDEPPLPAEDARGAAAATLQAMLESNRPVAMLELQSSVAAGGTFVQTPAVLVFEGPAEWGASVVQPALTAAVAPLWTNSGLGAAWVPATVGRQSVERLNGLGTLLYAIRGKLLFIGNDPVQLAATLDRIGAGTQAPAGLTYAAGFHHAREAANFERIMNALDFSTPGGNQFFPVRENGPAFFSANLASLSRVLSFVTGVAVNEEQSGIYTRQQIVYTAVP